MKTLSKIKPLIAYAVVKKTRPKIDVSDIFIGDKDIQLNPDEKIIKVKIEIIK